MAWKLEAEVELKSSAEKIWNGIRDSVTLFPKALPNHYQSIEVLEGDGKSVGSIRLVSYPPGLSEFSSIKEKVEEVDEEGKSVKYSVIDGEILKYYKNFKGGLSVKAQNATSSVKWWCEFDKATQEIPTPDFIKEFAINTFADLDAYLLAQPN